MTNPFANNIPTNSTPQIDPQAVASVKRMMNMLQSAQDPNKAMTMLAQQNPQIGALMQMANGGGSLKNMFYQKAQQMGIDPNALLSQLK